MRRVLIATVVLSLGSPVALAAGDVMANFYGNTVVASGGMVDTHS